MSSCSLSGGLLATMSTNGQLKYLDYDTRKLFLVDPNGPVGFLFVPAV